MRKLALLGAMVLCCATAHAQNGIRYALHAEKVTQAPLFEPLFLSVGWDFDHNDRFSGGLDFVMDMNWRQGYDSYYYGSGQIGDYEEKVKAVGLQYRSQYHFMDNDGTSLYLGSTVGFRMVRQLIEYQELVAVPFGSDYYRTRNNEGTGVLVPIGLRLGVRGPLDGGYGDAYVCLGYNAGSSDPFSPLSFLKEESMPSALMLQVGLAYGIGW